MMPFECSKSQDPKSQYASLSYYLTSLHSSPIPQDASTKQFLAIKPTNILGDGTDFMVLISASFF